MMGSDRNDADTRSPRRRASLRRRVSLSCEVIVQPHRSNLPEVEVVIGVVVEDQLLSPLELSLEDLHVQVVLVDLLLTGALGLEDLHVEVVLVDLLLAGALGLGFIALLAHQHADLVRSSHINTSRSPRATLPEIGRSRLGSRCQQPRTPAGR